MPLGKHSKTSKGTFRKERADSLAKNLEKDYPEFASVPGNTKLGALRKKYGVDSIEEVRRELREKK